MRFSRKAFVATGAAAVVGTQCFPARAAEAYTMRLGVPEAATSQFGVTALRFAVNVGRRSNGQLKVEVYPNGQLASQQEAIDALVSGALDFAIESSQFLESRFPRYQVFDMPFLFKTLEGGLRVLDGPIGAEFFAELEPKGIVGLAWGINAFKQFEMTSRAVTTPDDMKGLRIRIAAGGVYAAAYQALGAIPVTIDFAETYTALTQRTIDAVDLPVEVFTTSKYYLAVKHMAMSNHVLSLSPFLGSKKKIDALPASLQTIVREEAKALVPSWRAAVTRETALDIEFLKTQGVAFTQVQYAAFRKAVEPVYTAYAPKFGADLIDRISRVSG